MATRLQTPDLERRLSLLGFRDDDAVELLNVIDKVLFSPADVRRVAELAALLLSVIGHFGEPNAAFDSPAASQDSYGTGVLPMLALLVTVDEVRDFHYRRGVPDDLSWRALSDLGQQVWVHRLTYGEFGLHTQGWLCLVWSGAFYWLGRLQFNLQPDELAQVDELAELDEMAQPDSQQWVISCHIPQTGPLTPESVDDAFGQASDFFPRYFGDHPATDLYCFSWLLDPALAEVLPEQSNMVQFQQRWELYGESHDGDADAIFFTFRRRGDIDLGSLPTDTTLERAIIDRIRSGQHWRSFAGRIKGSGQ